jgi:hypothetical protein
MNRKYIVVLVAGALVMATTAWVLFPPRKPKSVGDPSTYKFMHCPKCFREKMYTPDVADKLCLYCDKPMVPTTERFSESNAAKAKSPYGLMFALLYVELLAVMAAIWWMSRKRTIDGDGESLYMNCPKCKQKIRYHERQIGYAAMCRRCKNSFIYPALATE